MTTRRQYLLTAVAAGTTGIAGCSLGDFGGKQTGDGRQDRYVEAVKQYATQIEEWRSSRAETVKQLSQSEGTQNGNIPGIGNLLKTEARELPGTVTFRQSSSVD